MCTVIATKGSRDYSTYKKAYLKHGFSDCQLCGSRVKVYQIAWRNLIQKLEGKTYAISNAYICTGSICGKFYRSAEAEILSLPNRAYSVDVIPEIGYLPHEEKKYVPEICYFLIYWNIEVSERKGNNFVHAYEELIAARNGNL